MPRASWLQRNRVPLVVWMAAIAGATALSLRQSESSFSAAPIPPSDAFGPMLELRLTGDEREVFFEPNGIMAIVGGEYTNGHWQPTGPDDYNHALEYGREFERRAGVTLSEPGTGREVRLDAGIRVHGSPVQRRQRTRGGGWEVCGCGPEQPPHCKDNWVSWNKFSLKLYFRKAYGAGSLDAWMIPRSPVAKMDELVLRAGSGQCKRFLRDEFARRIHARMGAVAPLGTFAKVYINDQYVGPYNLVQRLREPFFQEAHGHAGAWDIIEESDTVTAGDDESWSALLAAADAGDYTLLNASLNVDAFIDYLIVQTYTSNLDWPANNWTAARPRQPGAKFRFYGWDMESTFGNPTISIFERSNSGSGLRTNPSSVARLYRALREHEDFRARFAQRLDMHLAPGGALDIEMLDALYAEMQRMVADVYPAIDPDLRDRFLPERESHYKAQLREEGLYP